MINKTERDKIIAIATRLLVAPEWDNHKRYVSMYSPTINAGKLVSVIRETSASLAVVYFKINDKNAFFAIEVNRPQMKVEGMYIQAGIEVELKSLNLQSEVIKSSYLVADSMDNKVSAVLESAVKLGIKHGQFKISIYIVYGTREGFVIPREILKQMKEAGLALKVEYLGNAFKSE